MGVFEKLPTFVTVCVLVMIFACLKRHTRSARLTLWAVGWTLVFTHFLAQLLEPAGSHASPLLLALDFGALQAAAVVFLVSVSSVVEDHAKRTLLLLALGAPSVTYAAAMGWDVHVPGLYVLCLVGCLGGAACLFVSVRRKFSLYPAAVAVFCLLAGAWAVRSALGGSFYEGRVVLLGIGFGVAGAFAGRNYWSASPALLTISGGFLCWGAVLPISSVIDHFASSVLIPSALWETPKLFVAFGMILAVVEDKSDAIVGMQRQAEALNRQLERFSAITSRLLSGTSPNEICPDVALAITEASRFRAAVIHIEGAEGTLEVAGSSGLSQETVLKVQDHTQSCTSRDIQNLCSSAERLSTTTVLLSEKGAPFTLTGSMRNGEIADASCEILIPLCSAAGAYLGSITLAAPYDEKGIPAREIAPIESLAADLAVAVELKSLHTQLVWSEKLAAVGQLVAGVAHELNNPLTAIMGFGELMNDAITSLPARDHLKRLMSEARRMKRISDNLLRFSRQSSGNTNAAQFSPIVQEVLTLCEFYTRTSNVHVEVEVAPNLPSLALNEDEIKQILLNLFSNSCDALKGFAGSKQIRIRAFQAGPQVVIQVEDTGPGFTNLNRALDPFYTTKPVGKGTGLGLSICYGIAKKRGGNLKIENLQPHGGRVTLEVPVYDARPQALLVATAHA